MGRKRQSGEKPEKKTPIKIRMIPRKHAGKITEPWVIMEKMIAEKPCFGQLQCCKPRLVWAKDWKADVDGIATGAQVSKASELDRNLSEESAGETVDVFIKLPEQAWPTLDEIEKRHRIFHELCHIRPACNAKGEQKRDAKDRLLWRMRRHPITAFHEEIEEFGIERVIGHNGKVLESISHAERPMERLFDQAEARATAAGRNDNGQQLAATPGDPDTDDSWKKMSLAAAAFKANHQDALEAAGIQTLGELQEKMNRHGGFWCKELGINGRFKEPIEDCFNHYLTGLQKAAKKATAVSPQATPATLSTTNGDGGDNNDNGDPELDAKINALHDAGKGQRAIASELGVTVHRVRKVIEGD